MPSHIPVHSFGNKVSAAAEFLDIDIYIDGADSQGPVVAKLTMEVYIIDNLKANMLVGTGVLKAYRILLNLGTQTATITRCNNIKILICCVAKSYF